MASATELETGHTDVVHDTQFDYYSRYLATCSSDRTIKIFSASTTGTSSAPQGPLQVLTGHEGPVWMVAWAHPKFGTALASCSYDGRCIVWKDEAAEKSSSTMVDFKPNLIITAHTASVNAIAWAPPQFGRALATIGSDGKLFITQTHPISKDWMTPTAVCDGIPAESGGFPVTNQDAAAHPMGGLGVSWAPYPPQQPTDGTSTSAALLASCGCDSEVKIWISKASSTDQQQRQWSLLKRFNDHSDWVRDVAFCPVPSHQYVTFASCAQDKTVIIYRGRRTESGDGIETWEKSKPSVFADVIWRLSWSPCGSMLMVTTGTSQVFVLRQGTIFSDEWVRSPVEAVGGDSPSKNQ